MTPSGDNRSTVSTAAFTVPAYHVLQVLPEVASQRQPNFGAVPRQRSSPNVITDSSHHPEERLNRPEVLQQLIKLVELVAIIPSENGYSSSGNISVRTGAGSSAGPM